MKIRLNYVSNSSSSSFIIIGYKFIDNNYEILTNILHELNINVNINELENIYYFINNDKINHEIHENGLKIIIGDDDNGIEKGYIVIASNKNPKFDYDNGECQEFEENIENYINALKKYEKYIPEEYRKLKIIGGTYVC